VLVLNELLIEAVNFSVKGIAETLINEGHALMQDKRGCFTIR